MAQLQINCIIGLFSLVLVVGLSSCTSADVRYNIPSVVTISTPDAGAYASIQRSQPSGESGVRVRTLDDGCFVNLTWLAKTYDANGTALVLCQYWGGEGVFAYGHYQLVVRGRIGSDKKVEVYRDGVFVKVVHIKNNEGVSIDGMNVSHIDLDSSKCSWPKDGGGRAIE